MRFLRHLKKLVADLFGFARQNKVWWIVPLVLLLLLVGALVWALTPDQAALRALNFSWGIVPQGITLDIPGHLTRAERFVDTAPDFEKGDNVVITAGQPKTGRKPRGTNMVKIYRK